MFAKLWNDESGIAGLEYLLLATIVGLALVVGFSAVARAINVEFIELANAILSVDQSFSYQGISTCTASSGATSVTDSDSSISAAPVSDTAGSSNVAIGACTLAAAAP